jgi:hypothetical protein
MSPTRLVYRLLRWAAVSALLALLLMVWGIFDPRPIWLVIAMSIGQALGTLSFGIFCFVVYLDLQRARVFSSLASRFSTAPPSRPPPQGDDGP